MRTVLLLLFCQIGVFAQSAQLSTPDDKTLIIEDAPEMEVLSFGKTVIVKKHAKGVISFGGDVIVEGRIDGDAATVGGAVIQKENAFVGGDIIVFGGAYKPEGANPQRGDNKETVVFGVFEEEFRDLAQNPSHIFAPTFSLSFIVQRLLSVLFWFIVSLAMATVAPGAVSRSVARLSLSPLKIYALGVPILILTTVAAIAGFGFLPEFLSAIVGLMLFVLLLMAYVFGRVSLQVSTGKIIQKYIFTENSSETLAILIGTLAWTLFLSVPYVWTLGLVALFAAGIGLILTARTKNDWKKK